jgi:succinate-acetate transporter protein
VALMDLRSGNAPGGNTFLYFCSFFMLVSGVEFLIKSFAPGLDTRVDGWAWFALTLVVWLWTPAFFKSPLMLTVVVVALDIALPFITLMDLKVFPAEFVKAGAPIAAWSLMVSGLSAIYLASATILNGAFGKTVLPNPGPLVKARPSAAESAKA